MTDKKKPSPPKKPVPKKPQAKPKPKKKAAHNQVGDTIRGVMDEMPPEPKKVGRPSKYTEKLAEEIFWTIATNTCSLTRLCKERDHWPSAQNLHLWIAKNEKFREKYIEAKRLQALFLADETLEIADDTTNDELIDNNGNFRPNTEYIQRSKLRVETRKWHASKLAPKVWGDAKELDDERLRNQELTEKCIRLQMELNEKYKKDY